MKIYKAFEEAKNGTCIPVFLSGRSMESRYNPQRDAENLLATIDPSDCQFFLVLGLGSGLFIELLSQKYQDAKILVLELYDEDLEFLSQQERIQKLKNNPSITLVSLENIEEELIKNYLPAKYGNLKIIEQRGWINENQDKLEIINSRLKKTLGIISADYSVQAHFGKIWTSNILNNSIFAQGKKLSSLNDFSEELNKTAVIVAAGPSLDRTIKLLSNKNQRENYFIFATDTAGQALVKKGIIPELIVSIDGQTVSHNHFMNSGLLSNTDGSSPLFAFDLSSNSSAARYVYESGHKLMFFTSGHPLAAAINVSNGNVLPQFFSGAGTVTITALDMAIQSGFKNILILGADFSYSKGKAYTSGTYLDTLYNQSSSKIDKSEQTFSKLMFRTELHPLGEDIKTTDILQAYKESLEKYLYSRGITFTLENQIYRLHCPADIKRTPFPGPVENFSLENFISKVKKASSEEIETLLLPYIAWLRNNKSYKKLSYKELLKLALDTIVSYNM